MSTWIIGGVVLLLVGSILWRMISNKKQGKNTCSGSCQNCHIHCSSK